jgi:hypothetical protein
MSVTASPQAKDTILEIVRKQSPRPTELLELLQATLSYREVQDTLALLLDTGEIEMGSDRRLRVPQVAA